MRGRLYQKLSLNVKHWKSIRMVGKDQLIRLEQSMVRIKQRVKKNIEIAKKNCTERPDQAHQNPPKWKGKISGSVRVRTFFSLEKRRAQHFICALAQVA